MSLISRCASIISIDISMDIHIHGINLGILVIARTENGYCGLWLKYSSRYRSSQPGPPLLTSVTIMSAHGKSSYWETFLWHLSPVPSLGGNRLLLILIMRPGRVGMLAVFAFRRLAAHQWWANPDHDFSFSSFRFPFILCPFLSPFSFPFFVPSSP